MRRAVAALAPLVVLAIAALAASAHAAGEGAKLDLGEAFTRTCFTPGRTMTERRDALLQRGADLMPNEDPRDPAELFLIEDEVGATVFLVGPTSCTVASRDTSLASARRQFPGIVRAVSGGRAERLASHDALEALEDGEYVDVYEHRIAGSLVRYTLMITRNKNATTTVFMVVDDSAIEFNSKEKR